MDIATKTARTRSGEDSQHGRHVAVLTPKPAAHGRIRALLRRHDAERASAAAQARAPFRPRPTAGQIATGSASRDAAPRPPASLAEVLGLLTNLQLREIIDGINGKLDEEHHLRVTGNKADLVERIVCAVDEMSVELPELPEDA